MILAQVDTISEPEGALAGNHAAKRSVSFDEPRLAGRDVGEQLQLCRQKCMTMGALAARVTIMVARRASLEVDGDRHGASSTCPTALFSCSLVAARDLEFVSNVGVEIQLEWLGIVLARDQVVAVYQMIQGAAYLELICA